MKNKGGKIMVFWAVLALAISGCATAAHRWQAVNQLNSVESYKEFLSQYPDSEYASRARGKLTALYEQQEWNWTRRQNTIIAYEIFLAGYPKGANAKEANAKLEKLYYERIGDGDDISAYMDFLKRYPNSVYKNSAWLRAEVSFLKQAKNLNTSAAYEDFLKKFPDGAYASEAKALAGKINEAADKERERLGKLEEILKELNRQARERRGKRERESAGSRQKDNSAF